MMGTVNYRAYLQSLQHFFRCPLVQIFIFWTL